ncbi:MULTISPECIES: segregation/condensation protein A [unclassified Streptomyces]|uniref:segregation and condensation protein A n=1 Tax=unclassified Streptomyces TaxID=2593676 RepID=UPI002E81EA62|nr:segregation/condensation protein A [Streptomyces sp. NBC_00589]WTI40316.1 segregation/condensation protein A [Streptomyces sp. NBC_00775]WUB26002.1 segregation/condensation protein A [Streptomyces sp. NBC_00589]
MTSNDVPVPAGGSAGRRRALGRGPGAAPPAEAPAEVLPPSAEPEPPAAEGEPLVEDGSSSADRGALRPPVPPGGTTAHNAGGAAEEPPAAARTEAPAEPETSAGPEAPAEPEALAGPEASAEPEAPAGAEAPVEPEAPAEAGDGVFKVRLSNFEGPFDLLLQLISKHKLDVTEVALSKVTDEFMAHIRAMGPDWDLDQTTEFLVVAATLLDLKAARLLPSAEVEDEGDLALLEARDLLFARLLQYRAYKQIADIFNARLEEEARRYPRTVGLEAHHAELLPEVVISIGAEGFAKLAVKAMQPRPKPQVYVDHIHAPLVSVQEQAGIVVARLRELGEASFRALVEDTDDTLTVVARFLALLELYREKAVALDQEEALGDLMVRWTGGDGDEQPTVTDEFDRPPEEAKDEAKKDAKKDANKDAKKETA